MKAAQRQQEIINILASRGQETIPHLAAELDVSERTIHRDITELSAAYPIVTMAGRYGGGVKLMDGYRKSRKFLTKEQIELLQRLVPDLEGKDQKTLLSILREFLITQRAMSLRRLHIIYIYAHA